jgi:S-adenosylmethionine hydrolase
MSGIITLTTDFGTADGYVAAMKGVILGINPAAQLIDISHRIQPQNISQAAFVLNTACHFFPEGTVHLVVVDPGVGTERRAVILRTPQADFVAPDNGALSQVLWESGQIISRNRHPANRTGLRKLPPAMTAVAITRPEFWRQPVSATFHGRDIFAPVAARLSLGANLADFGEEVSSLRTLPFPETYREAIIIEVGGRRICGLSETYGEQGGLKALVGSNGYLEIAFSGGSAGAFLGAAVGNEVKISTGNR